MTEDTGGAVIDDLLGAGDCYGAPGPEDEARFASAMAAADAWHRERNRRYRQLWDGGARPMIPVGLLRQVDLTTSVQGSSLPERGEASGIRVSTSGTTSGRPLSVHLDEISLGRIRLAMWRMFAHHGFVGHRPARFLLLSPDPTGAAQPGFATAFHAFTACAPTRDIVHAVDASGALDAELAWGTLASWARDEGPIYVFGLTAHFDTLVRSASDAIGAPGPIKVITGGGWKGVTATLTRPEIVCALRERLPDAELDIRDIYGMTEHPLHYLSCTRGRFHAPRFARFHILDAGGAACEAGEDGLIRLECPLMASLPVHDLLTVDVGRRRPSCDCGEAAPAIELVGRAASPAGTCAWRATGARAP